jgi:hypothetical protein
MDMKDYQHEDLEERFQISADIEFSLIDENFEGLKPIDIKVKKKQTKKTEVENVELRKSTGGKSTGGLF